MKISLPSIVNSRSSLSTVNEYSVVEGSISGDKFQIFKPRVSNGELVLYTHGSGETETALQTDPLKLGIINMMISEGYTLACSAAAGENWGNQAGINAHAKLAALVKEQYRTRSTTIFSQSMGGLAGLSLINQRKISDLNGWFGIFPCTNLASLYPLWYPGIQPAYNIAGDGSDFAQKTAGYSPVTFSSIPFQNLRMRFYASPDDTYVSKADNSDQMSALVSGKARENTVVLCSGNHGDPSHFQPNDVLAFLRRL